MGNLKDQETYIRVGTTYFKKVLEPNVLDNNKTVQKLVKWDRASIIEDHGREYLKTITKYDGFINIPSHTDYQKSIENFYNEYYELEGGIEEGEMPYTILLLKHIFREQYVIGFDYLTILWRYPTQILPILSLVSEERNTGKTTFLNWLSLLFGSNVSLLKKQDFKSNFNSSWINSLIVALDEIKFETKAETNYIKELSTSKLQQREQKQIDKKQVPFFGKLVLASNAINDFIVIDKEEIRFWVLEIDSIRNYIDDFEDKLIEELPAFKYFLNSRTIFHKKESRMWFSPELLQTQALKRIKINSAGFNEKDLKGIIENFFEISNQDTIKLTLGDIFQCFKDDRVFVSKSEIKQILQNKWKLFPTENATTYKFYSEDLSPGSSPDSIYIEDRKGRVYLFEKDMIEAI
jgi:hypothetical protein